MLCVPYDLTGRQSLIADLIDEFIRKRFNQAVTQFDSEEKEAIAQLAQRTALFVYEEFRLLLNCAATHIGDLSQAQEYRRALLQDLLDNPGPVIPQITIESYTERIWAKQSTDSDETWRQRPSEEYLAVILVEGEVADEPRRTELGKLFTKALAEWKKDMAKPPEGAEPWRRFVKFALEHGLESWMS